MKFCPWLLWSGLEQRAVLTVWALGRARVLQESLRAPCVVPWDRFGWLGRRHWAFPGGARGKEPTCQCESCGRCSFVPWVGETPWREGLATHSSILAWSISMDRGAWRATVHGGLRVGHD